MREYQQIDLIYKLIGWLFITTTFIFCLWQEHNDPEEKEKRELRRNKKIAQGYLERRL